MARFFGKVGYEPPGVLVGGVYKVTMTERAYKGDVLDTVTSLSPSDQVNDGVRSQNPISVVADAYALENFTWIKYVLFNGVRWRAETVRVARPRLIITLGGVWNGDVPADTEVV